LMLLKEWRLSLNCREGKPTRKMSEFNILFFVLHSLNDLGLDVIIVPKSAHTASTDFILLLIRHLPCQTKFINKRFESVSLLFRLIYFLQGCGYV
jgi:hypothetical protein